MDENSFINLLMVKPIFKGWNKDLLKDAIKSSITLGIDRIANRYAFNFAWRETTTTTVADQSDYELTDKARDVLNVLYGDDKLQLHEFSPIDVDHYQSNRDASEPQATTMWCRIEDTADGLVQIRLIGTPETTGDTITYKYLRKDMNFGDFPSEWYYVLADSIAITVGDFGIMEGGQVIRTNYRADFERSISEMISHYDKSPGEPKPVRLSQYNVNRNRERNNLYGY